MLKQDVPDANTTRQPCRSVHESALLLLSRLVLRLGTIDTHRLGFETNFVTGWQLTLSQDNQVANDIRRSNCLVIETRILLISQQALHLGTTDMHHSR